MARRKNSHFLILPALLAALAAVTPFAQGANERLKLGDIPEDKKDVRPTDTPFPLATPAPEVPLEVDVAEEFYQKGVKALNAGQLEQAEAFFDRVLVLNPDHKGAQEGIAFIMKSMEDKPVEVKPDPKVALLKKLESDLESAYAAGDWDDAQNFASKIIAINPDHRGAKLKMAQIRKKLAGQAIERALDRESKEDYFGAIDAYQLAQSYAPDASIQQKIKDLRAKAADQKLKKSDALYIDALTANQSGKIEEAIALCKKALALNPKNLQAQRMLERLESKAPVPELK